MTAEAHRAQLELVRASLAVELHPDTYRDRPKPGPIQPPAVDRSSWTGPTA